MTEQRAGPQAVAAMIRLGQDTEWHRLLALASALEAAHHAIVTVGHLVENRDFGEKFPEQSRAAADELYRLCGVARQRAEAREKAAREGD